MKLFKLIPSKGVKIGLIVIRLGIIAIILTYIRTLFSPWMAK